MYRVVADSATLEQVAALPVEALSAYAELLTTLEVAPWSGRPQHEANPDGAVRRWAFGPRRDRPAGVLDRRTGLNAYFEVKGCWAPSLAKPRMLADALYPDTQVYALVVARLTPVEWFAPLTSMRTI